MAQAGTWFKMLAGASVLCIGGPALVYYVSPTEEQLFQRYNPELQARSLANRARNQEEFDDFVKRLKEYSKSDKPIWEAQAVAERQRAVERREQVRRENQGIADEARRLQEDVRGSAR